MWRTNGRKSKAQFNMFQELLDHPNDEEEAFIDLMRMDKKKWRELVAVVKPFIDAQHQQYPGIPAEERLYTAIRYLASCRTYVDLQFEVYRSPGIIGQVVYETCAAIAVALNKYIVLPKTSEEWEKKAKEFEARWGFPNCLGAIDNKHIVIRKPNNAGQKEFLNYQDQHSIHLMALVDARGLLMMFDVGEKGRFSDGTVFETSEFKRLWLDSGKLNIPTSRKVGSDNLPFVFLADAAFRNNNHILVPYNRKKKYTAQQSKLNYEHSRTRQIVECSFGGIGSIFDILSAPMRPPIDRIKVIVSAICCLYNFIQCDQQKINIDKIVYTRDNVLNNNLENRFIIREKSIYICDNK